MQLVCAQNPGTLPFRNTALQNSALQEHCPSLNLRGRKTALHMKKKLYKAKHITNFHNLYFYNLQSIHFLWQLVRVKYKDSPPFTHFLQYFFVGPGGGRSHIHLFITCTLKCIRNFQEAPFSHHSAKYMCTWLTVSFDRQLCPKALEFLLHIYFKLQLHKTPPSFIGTLYWIPRTTEFLNAAILLGWVKNCFKLLYLFIVLYLMCFVF